MTMPDAPFWKQVERRTETAARVKAEWKRLKITVLIEMTLFIGIGCLVWHAL